MIATEAEARELTFRAYHARNRGRLFPLPPPQMNDRADWDRADEAYWGKAVGVMPMLENLDSRSDIVVGEWRGIGPAFLGIALQIRAFHVHGVTTNRSPLNIAYIYILPNVFQRIVEHDWKDMDADDVENCVECGYVFKEDERYCNCYMCGGCCRGHCVGAHLLEANATILAA